MGEMVKWLISQMVEWLNCQIVDKLNLLEFTHPFGLLHKTWI